MRAQARVYGSPPFNVAVIHGGPGAAGEMAPVARALSAACGVVEPLQAEKSIEGQVEELTGIIERRCPTASAILIGYSWGALLSLITAARHPSLVAKLILVSCPPLEERYSAAIQERRLRRLPPADRHELERLLADAARHSQSDPNMLVRLGELAQKADSYELLPTEEPGETVPDQEIFRRVWGEATAMRAQGELAALAREVRCPIVAVHGDHDPHPAEGVEEPLKAAGRQFRLFLLERCGHTPWRERYARERFFEVVRGEIGGGCPAEQSAQRLV